MQRQTTNSTNLKKNITDVYKLRQDIIDIPIMSRIEREVALYDVISIVEGLPLTVKEKAELSGITYRKYQYSRRVVKDYPDSASIRKAMAENGAFSIMNYRTKKPVIKSDLYDSFYKWMKRRDMSYTTPKFVEMVIKIHSRVVVEKPFNADTYFEYQPCVICGALPIEKHTLLTNTDGIRYTQCDDCIDNGFVPSDKDLLKMMTAYSSSIYENYLKVINLL